jgi:hypothetical protein
MPIAVQGVFDVAPLGLTIQILPPYSRPCFLSLYLHIDHAPCHLD